MSTMAVYEFRQNIAGGDTLEPPFYSQKQWPIGQTYTTQNDTVSVQITPQVPIRISTDGSPAIAGVDRYAAANDLITVVFAQANNWPINTVAG